MKEKRSSYIMVRTREDEKAPIKEAARKNGMGMSEYIRSVVLKEANTEVKNDDGKRVPQSPGNQ